MQRTTFRTRHLFAGALAVAAFGVVPPAARATTVKVVPIGHGTVRFTPAPQTAPDGCASEAVGQTTDLLSGSCEVQYAPGTVVRFEAIDGVAVGQDPATEFRRWSDDRCPTGAAGACQLTVGSEPLTVAALFSPQRVSVQIAGSAGQVSISPPGLPGGPSLPCDVATATPDSCYADFDPDLSGPVRLSTDQTDVTWAKVAGSDGRTLCDSPPDTTCTVFPGWPRWGSVGVGAGVEPNDQVPSAITVDYRVAKSGSGSGTVRSTKLDCGGRCSAEAGFGQTETFTAVPDTGSRFDGWRAACGSAPTCRLAIGPVTSLTAVFQRAGAVAGTGTRNPGTKKQQQQRRGAFAARVLGLSVRGHGRRRTLSIRLRVNGPATVRARLLRGRRQVASHRWRVRRAGVQVLRMRVPARARQGSYRVRLTISGRGRTLNVTKGVRLRR